MLLLVLILVLIAFSLLVVALLSGSVLWAWVSVGVSVAAAAVLLIDYLQRRSAVKAGADVGTVATPSRAGGVDVEPVTEVLPVIPRSGSAAGGENAVNGNQADASTALFDEGADAQQTVVMPVVQPSASGDRPSGATQGTTSSSGDSSPTVTTTGSDRSPSGSRPGDAAEVSPAADGASESAPEEKKPAGDATVVVDSSKVAAPETAQAPEQGAEASGTAAGAAGSAPETDAAADGDPPEEPRDEAAAAVVAALDTEVLVIDEQPRYHVPGCKSLAGKALIPLPAREAVDLGFTPCGWCSPDRTLAAQQAASH